MINEIRLCLVGMPGVGKSTAGRMLAKQLKVQFFDSDAVIEQRLCGETIKQFFSRCGEEAFRDLESEVLAELVGRGGEWVLATGGGAVLRERNRELLRTHSTVIYLRSSPDEIFRRLRGDTQRPLLQVPNPQQKLRDLYAQRDPFYRRCSHYAVETGRPAVHTLCNMILMQLELDGSISSSRVPATVGVLG
ncbi:shikimate kinase [Roseateles sp. BYS180W]|uniref:Shikimate kinase n=1 Tax=Roseateles rivi TaxID=3299028 RepID=A0ABW7FRC7_9BURK